MSTAEVLKQTVKEKYGEIAVKSGACCGDTCCSDADASKNDACCDDTCCGDADASEGDDRVEALKQTVKEKYGEIAVKSGACCGDTCGCVSDVSESYDRLDGYYAAADLNLGCGLPTEYAGIQPGHVVLDLGSGAGNDVFVARRLTGETGRVIGVDMTPEMIARANQNRAKLGYANVEFRLGDIERLPVADDEVDVIISNCVLNLVPNKEQAFNEMYRVLKPGGRFCVSDIVVNGRIPADLQRQAELYAGCVSGAIQRADYIGLLVESGFRKVVVKKERQIVLDERILAEFLSDEQLAEWHAANVGIFSVTVVGTKPA